MRTATQEINIYKFGDDSIVDEKIKENMDYRWDLYEHNMIERITTLKVIADLLDADLDYSLSCVPDRGEFIKFTPKYDDLNFQALWDAINIETECPLTGVYYDHDFIDNLSKHSLLTPNKELTYNDEFYKIIDGLNNASICYIESIHDEYESMLKDDYIKDLCDVNNYEFTSNGELY